MRTCAKSVAFAALLLAWTVGAGKAASQVGVSGGLNFADLDDIDAGDHHATFDRATGWHLQLWFDLPLGPVTIRPGIRYTDMGELLDGATVDSLPAFSIDESAQLLEIPIDVRFRFGPPSLRPYFMLGPVLRFPAGEDERFRSFSLAGGAGGGVELGLGGLRLYPELKYTFGITRFTEDTYEIGGITLTPDDDQRLNAIMLSIGIGM